MADPKKNDAKDDPIAKFKKWYDKANKIAETTKLAHSEAYIKAAELLKDEDGNVDLEKLEKEDMQKNFTDAMYGHLYSKAQKHFKSKLAMDDPLTADRLMQAYTNTTYKEIHDLVRTHKKDYNIDKHENTRDGLIRKLRQELTVSAGGHLGESDKEGLVKSMKNVDFIDHNRATIDELLGAYNIYKQSGNNLTRESLIQAYKASDRPAPLYLKKPKA